MESREDEIVGGLVNAIERGESLQNAMQSFLNAGYTSQEVELAASKIGGATPVANVDQTQTSNPVNVPAQIQSLPKANPDKPKSSTWMIVLLLLSLGLVIAALVLVFVFKDVLF